MSGVREDAKEVVTSNVVVEIVTTASLVAKIGQVRQAADFVAWYVSSYNYPSARPILLMDLFLYVLIIICRSDHEYFRRLVPVKNNAT